MRQWYRITAQAEGVADIYLYGSIGTSWFDDAAVSAKQFLKDLQALPATVKAIHLHVNSPGGDPFDATAIHNLLRQQAADGRRIEVTIDGIAASSATIVTSAGDVIRIAENALMFIHNPAGFAMGTAEDMLKMAEALETIRESIVASYRRHAKLDDAGIKALMDAETWMTAEDAIAHGFATEISAPAPVVASLDLRGLRALGTVPDGIRARLEAMRIRAQEEEWRVGGDRDLPLDEESAWDSAEADKRVQKWASSDGSGDKDKIDWDEYRRSQICSDANNREQFQGYKLGFADVVDGRLTANRAGLIASRVVLNGGRGGVDLPEDVIERAKAFVDGYLGEPEEETEDSAAPMAAEDVLAAVTEARLDAGLATVALAQNWTKAQLDEAIAAGVAAREAAETRANEIRALCATAKCPDLADALIRGQMSIADVQAHLTTITAKLAQAEIDAHLPPDGLTGMTRTRLNPQQIYAERRQHAERSRLGQTKEG